MAVKNVADMPKTGAPESFERRTPFAQEAEACVLSAMLMDREAIGLAVELLTEDCFYMEPHRKLYQAVLALYEKSVAVDPVTLSEQLRKAGTLEEIGGLPFIFEVAGTAPTAANITFHAQIVREKSMLRKLIAASTETVAEANQPVEDVEPWWTWPRSAFSRSRTSASSKASRRSPRWSTRSSPTWSTASRAGW